jgi:hypothetical protein
MVVQKREGFPRTGGATAPFLFGLAGCDSFSLISDMLCEGRRARPLLALLGACWNLTSLRGRVMFGDERRRRECFGRYRSSRCVSLKAMCCDCRGERGQRGVYLFQSGRGAWIQVGQAQCEKRRTRNGHQTSLRCKASLSEPGPHVKSELTAQTTRRAPHPPRLDCDLRTPTRRLCLRLQLAC